MLTHTMDANWEKYCREAKWKTADDVDEENKVKNDEMVGTEQEKMSAHIAVYKAVVTGNESEAWNAWKHMDRPMWESTFTE